MFIVVTVFMFFRLLLRKKIFIAKCLSLFSFISGSTKGTNFVVVVKLLLQKVLILSCKGIETLSYADLKENIPFLVQFALFVLILIMFALIFVI